MHAATDRNKHPLPVVTASTDGDIYVTAGTKDLQAPDGARMMIVECLAGTSHIKKGNSGDLPAPWPPAADVTDGSAPWYELANGGVNQVREVAVSQGDAFRLVVGADSVVQVFWY
ncbi:MAG: hypothetical protein RPU13_07580 [Candidatus Sedimenticola sp. (ex Thyasira tokunagai)]